MALRVLVVRPQPGAAATAEALERAGHEPVVMPLTQIAPLASPQPAGASFDAVAATSANAIRQASPTLIEPLRDVPLCAVGEATARAARAAGFRRVETAEGDADRLAEMILDRFKAGSRLLYLCGKVRRREFEAALVAAGIEVQIAETYDTVAVHPDDGQLAALGAVDAVLVHSAEAAKALLRLRSRAGSFLERAAFIAISQRAAEPLRAAGITRLLVAESPTEAAMFACLGQVMSDGL